ncbi:MAG: hypothetical protein ACYC5H_03860 [Methylovirgula sp.]
MTSTAAGQARVALGRFLEQVSKFGRLARALERFPLDRVNHPIERKALQINKLEHVLIRKVDQLFWNML